MTLVLLASVVLMGAGHASAQEPPTTAEAVAALARAAGTDDGALRSLRAVRRIDGQDVDLDAATAGIDDDPDRVDRLGALADQIAGSTGGSAPTPIDADAARAEAEAVLEGDEFQTTPPPRPFKGPLEWLGDRLAPVGRVLGGVFGPVIDAIASVPGGPYLVTAILAAAAVAWAVVLVSRRSNAAVVEGVAPRLLVDVDADPAELEAEAAAAEDAGRFGVAVRLRYEAGLIRLVRAGMLELHPDTTARRVAAAVGGPTIAALTHTFEEIVYGGEPATADDVAASRAGWSELLGQKARR